MRPEQFVALGLRGGGGQRERDADARDGRAEIVRGTHQHALVAFNEIVDLAGHGVKVLDQVGNFVAAGAAGESGARLQIALGDGVGGVAQTEDGPGDVLRQNRTEQRGEQRAEKNHEQQAARQGAEQRRREEFADEDKTRGLCVAGALSAINVPWRAVAMPSFWRAR